jgi:carbon-monoxide dehydrogenase large subunit
VALIVAETLDAAKDAAECLEVEYETLPAVTTAKAALGQNAPLLWDEARGNVCVRQSFGDSAAVEAAFAAADLVVAHDFVNTRVANAQMEPRSALGQYDPATGVTTLIAGSQGAVRQKAVLAAALNLSPEKVVVISPDVGGGFGPRSNLYPEAVLVAWAARRLSRPVKWTSERTEAFLADFQGRDCVTEAALALSRDGRFLGLRVRLLGNIGAHPVSFVPLNNGYRISTTAYDIAAASAEVCGVLTNTVPTAPYRGAGRPEATFVIERLIDMAARRLGIDRLELRAKNLIRRAALPYRNPFGLTYDSGDFPANMARATARAGWPEFPARREEAKRRNRLRGIGLANYVESPVGAPREKVVLTVEPEGAVRVVVGTQSTGQGHETSFAQVIAAHLGVDMDSVALVTGDTRVVAVGGGTHSDRSMRLAGTLLVEASGKIVAAARASLARMKGIDEGAVDFADGLFHLRNTNDAWSLFDVARLMADLPDGAGALTASAEFFGRIPAYPTGCAVCEVEIDPETGTTRIVRYTAVDDVGQMINPLIVHGQVHGGIAQGAGQALLENVAVDRASGQVLSASFIDYAMPRADNLPSFSIEAAEDPTAGNPLRVKGGGESGITPATAAIVNAVVDALSGHGVEHIDMPVTAERVWRALAKGNAAPAPR